MAAGRHCVIRIAIKRRKDSSELFFQSLQGDYIFDRDRHNSRNATLPSQATSLQTLRILASDSYCHAIEPSQRKAVEGFVETVSFLAHVTNR